MLDTLRLNIWKNYTATESGIDSYQRCHDKNHFLNFPYPVTYQYNSRGFRDEEWPTENLQDCIWCVGDSFTVGVGSPVEHTWVKVLQNETGIRTINISMDGASNSWIARNSIKILKEVKPKNMVIMFSYFHRREAESSNIPEHQKRLRYLKYETFEDDMRNFQWCRNAIENNKHETNVIYSTIPNPVSKDNRQYLNFDFDNYLGEVSLLDYARDHHHFDKNTSIDFVKKVIPLLAK